MKKSKQVLLYAVILAMVVLGLSTIGFAGEKKTKDEAEGGFSGEIILEGGISGGHPSQLEVADDNKRVNNLNHRSAEESEVSPMITGSLQYTWADSGTTIFVDSDEFSLGISQDLGDLGEISIAGMYDKSEVWKDPYLTGVNRSKTDAESVGLSIDYEEILGTGFNASSRMVRVDVDEDLIGIREKDLQRDGWQYEIGVGYTWEMNDRHLLRPEFSYQRNDKDGKSNSGHGFNAGMAHEWAFENSDLSTSINMGRTVYDKSHPVYNKKRKAVEYGIETLFSYYSPFGWEDITFYTQAGYEYVDENIDFFDATAWSVGVGIGYSF